MEEDIESFWRMYRPPVESMEELWFERDFRLKFSFDSGLNLDQMIDILMLKARRPEEIAPEIATLVSELRQLRYDHLWFGAGTWGDLARNILGIKKEK